MIKIIQAPSDQSKLINTLGRFSEAGALCRLFSAAIVDGELRERLLREPLSVIAEGYNGENFFLGEQVLEAIVRIKAKNLAEFATELLQDLDQVQPQVRDSRSTSDWYIFDDFSDGKRKTL